MGKFLNGLFIIVKMKITTGLMSWVLSEKTVGVVQTGSVQIWSGVGAAGRLEG